MYRTRIEMTEKKYIKNPNTETTYILEEEEKKVISKEMYHNITCEDTLKWFRRLGGSETAQRNYTRAGYLIAKLISTCPSKEMKTIRTFEFIEDNRIKYGKNVKPRKIK
tara:strand:+ start:671 stop:997 length:327 start_codon:yes stop_codon:yes gene_type:complete